jgi:hypothetical protein
MSQQIEIRERPLSIIVKIGIVFWMFSIIFVYLLLFGPPEFWSISERIGVSSVFQEWRGLLQPLFTAVYLS